MKSIVIAALLASIHSSQPYAAIADPRPAIELTDNLESRILKLTEQLEKIKAHIDKKDTPDG